MFECLTQAAAVSVSAGGSVARVSGHKIYEPLHLLAGLLTTEIIDLERYEQYGVTPDVVQKTLIEQYTKSEPHWELKLPFSDSSMQVLKLAQKDVAGKNEALTTRGHLIMALSSLTSADLGITLECALKDLVRDNLDYLKSRKTDKKYNIGVLSLSKNELLAYAVHFSKSEPNWRSILVSDLGSKGLSIADVEKQV